MRQRKEVRAGEKRGKEWKEREGKRVEGGEGRKKKGGRKGRRRRGKGRYRNGQRPPPQYFFLSRRLCNSFVGFLPRRHKRKCTSSTPACNNLNLCAPRRLQLCVRRRDRGSRPRHIVSTRYS